MFDQTKRIRGGFTLVELMVVIVIIIILMGLLTPVLINVMARAREARITAEISALDGALKAYKERYGAYPPSDFMSQAGQATVQAHLSHLFPRCNPALEMQAIPTFNSNTGVATAGMSAAQALVFWLSGFSSDPEHPLSAHYPSTSYTPPSVLPLNPLYQFDQTRVTINGSPAPIGAGSGSTVAVPVYSPADAQKTPYLYFAAQNYSTQPGWTGTQGDKCLPYLLDNGPNLNAANPYANPSTFQIISAGLDGSFGNAANWTGTPGANGYSFTALCSYPSGNAAAYSGFSDGGAPDQTAIQKSVLPYSQGDLDNLTNFSTGNLKDATSH